MSMEDATVHGEASSLRAQPKAQAIKYDAKDVSAITCDHKKQD